MAETTSIATQARLVEALFNRYAMKLSLEEATAVLGGEFAQPALFDLMEKGVATMDYTGDFWTLEREAYYAILLYQEASDV